MKVIQTYPVHWIKNVFKLLRNPLTYMMEVKDFNPTFVKYDVGGKTYFYLTADHEVARHVFQTNHRNYYKSDSLKELQTLIGTGLFTSEGDFWRKQRRLAQPAFHRKKLVDLFEIMQVVTKDFAKELEKLAKIGKPFDMFNQMMMITLQVVTKALFSTGMTDEELQAVYKNLGFLLDHASLRATNPLYITWFKINGQHKKFLRERQKMDDIVFGIIERRRKEPAGSYSDLLDMLMYAEDADTGERMSDKQLRDEIMTFFIAGHETSAIALTWLWYLLEKNPDVMRKLRAEATEVLGDRMATFADLPNLVYTRQTIDETLRMYPPVWATGRTPLETDSIKDYKIPKGSDVLLFIYAIHHNPEIWENPYQFNPDRFTPELKKKQPKGSYVPFGAGPRLCIGDRFAIMEMQLIVSEFVRRFDFELIDKSDRTLKPVSTLRSKEKIEMRVKMR